MCGTCGCGDPKNVVSISLPGEKQKIEVHTHEHKHGDKYHSHEHEHHSHDHTHNHSHDHSHAQQRVIEVEQDILSANNLLAERNRGYFDAKNVLSINLMSSPGSGKTSLLEKTIVALKEQLNLYVVEGDQQTMNDANRIDKAGAPVVQVNTGNGCHLDADMVNQAVKKLQIKENSLVFIENVGNLVCPSLFDLGESKRVVIISVTEGDDKPLKYPVIFKSADLCIINKIDLLPYVDFDVKKVKEYALQVNHHLTFFEVSAKTDEGLSEWYGWLTENFNAK